MEELEIENARLRAWLEVIQETAAEVRIIDMATMAIAKLGIGISEDPGRSDGYIRLAPGSERS